MCYVCEACGALTPPKTPSHLRIVETRPKVYQNGFDEEGKVRESRGSEIVKEIQVCPDCRKEEDNPVIMDKAPIEDVVRFYRKVAELVKG